MNEPSSGRPVAAALPPWPVLFPPLVACDGVSIGYSNMSHSKKTTDHAQIRRWVEARGGRPARVQATGTDDDAGLLRIDFPESHEEDEDLEEISWEEFFEKFDEKRLAFLYQDTTASGKQSRFNKLVSR